MTDSWLVWGRGGHGRVVAELIGAAGGWCVGFADHAPAGDQCVSEDDLITALNSGSPLPFGASHVALGIGNNAARLHAWHQVPAAHGSLLVHPTAFVAASARIGAGTVVLPRAVVHTDASVGEAVIVNSGAIIEHDCRIGDGSHLSPGAVLAGGVTVGARAWIGAGAVVLPGVVIESDAVVGAGAVVTRAVPMGVTVVGNPARVAREEP
jgi:sugar O-acyltransferase (sialic acid O-acetyltransferase NeuD family)